MDDDPAAVHEGGCLCKKVRYKVFGPPRYQANCHCSFCKMVTGSAYLCETVFLKTDVESFGAPLTIFEIPSPAHGRIMRVHFCSTCGTTIGLTFERFPAVQAIFAGTFDDPTWFPVLRHIFVGSAMPDIAFPSNVEVFIGHSIKLDGSPEIPLPERSSPWSVSEVIPARHQA